MRFPIMLFVKLLVCSETFLGITYLLFKIEHKTLHLPAGAEGLQQTIVEIIVAI